MACKRARDINTNFLMIKCFLRLLQYVYTESNIPTNSSTHGNYINIPPNPALLRPTNLFILNPHSPPPQILITLTLICRITLTMTCYITLTLTCYITLTMICYITLAIYRQKSLPKTNITPLFVITTRIT
jgi:hypothetical protein